jgi:hypothetical protein
MWRGRAHQAALSAVQMLLKYLGIWNDALAPSRYSVPGHLQVPATIQQGERDEIVLHTPKNR